MSIVPLFVHLILFHQKEKFTWSEISDHIELNKSKHTKTEWKKTWTIQITKKLLLQSYFIWFLT